MREPTQKEIENRAYQLWEQHGRPKGRDHDFWKLAEQELRSEYDLPTNATHGTQE